MEKPKSNTEKDRKRKRVRERRREGGSFPPHTPTVDLKLGEWGDERKLLPWKPLPSRFGEVYYVAMCDFSARGLSAVKIYRAMGAMRASSSSCFHAFGLTSNMRRAGQRDSVNIAMSA